ncbi:MAG: SDR family NAD(P)-dependent oxidoreductase [Chloroflexi bacterium]|nr:SDR family NAD(P)-dependent oxidoreductase [Chloroflexota bacterium]
MNGKTVLITGGTNGIGKVTALELAKQGAAVVIIGRSPRKTAETVAAIQQQSGSQSVESIIADLSSMAEVRRAASEFKARHSRLDVLVNNAGAVFAQRQQTVDGYEMTFALNHLAYFLLTNLLLDTLKASAPARIVNVSSDVHKGAKLNFDDLQHQRSYGMGGLNVYGESKLANVLFTNELARRLQGTGVTVNSLHPGMVRTGFGRNNGGMMRLIMPVIQRFGISEEEGAQTSIYLASSPEVEGVTGKYFDKSKATPSSPESYDEAAQKRLWAVSEELTGVAEKVH